MTTLGQIVGIHKTTRTQIQRDWDSVLHTLEKPELFTGFDKKHYPYDGFLLQPHKEKRVQANATTLVYGLQELLTRLFDLEATKDSADTSARADVKVTFNGTDYQTILYDVPVNHLLWLEKRVINLLTTFRAIPVVSAAESWQPQPGDWGVLRTAEDATPTTSKEEGFQIVVPAADNNGHPAAYEKVTKDTPSGVYKEVKFTAAMRPDAKAALIKRASVLLDGIKQAITAANHLEVTDIKEGAAVFGFLFDTTFEH